MAFGALDKVAANEVTNTARARVQHDPNILVLIEADLDKVVARAQCTYLALHIAALEARVFAGDILEPIGKAEIKVGHVFAFMLATWAQGHAMLDLMANRGQIIG